MMTCQPIHLQALLGNLFHMNHVGGGGDEAEAVAVVPLRTMISCLRSFFLVAQALGGDGRGGASLAHVLGLLNSLPCPALPFPSFSLPTHVPTHLPARKSTLILTLPTLAIVTPRPPPPSLGKNRSRSW